MAEHPLINHNGGPPLVEDDRSATRIRVIRIHINDWVASTRGMSLEEEGFFWRIHLLLYDRMGVLIDDDAYNAKAMSLDIRTYKRVKTKLLAQGKLFLEEGRLSHPRIVREIEMFVAEYRRRSAAARQREERKRDEVVDEIGRTSAEDRPDFAPTSAGSRPEVGRKSEQLRPELQPQKNGLFNENNGCDATTVGTSQPEPSRARAFPKPKPKPFKKDSPLPPKGESGDPLMAAFREFWAAFPPGRKKDTAKAAALFRKIVSGQHKNPLLRAKAIDIVEGAKRFAATKPDPEYTPMPTTWLNGGRWLDDQGQRADELVGPNGERWGWWRGKEDSLRRLTDAEWDAAIAAAKPNGTWPWWKLTPPFGHKESLMPESVATRWGFIEKYQGKLTAQAGGKQ